MPKRIVVKQSAHRPSLQKEAWFLQKCAAAGSAAKILKIYTVYHRTPVGQGFVKTMTLHLTTGRSQENDQSERTYDKDREVGRIY
jgi:hypothetical protein